MRKQNVFQYSLMLTALTSSVFFAYFTLNIIHPVYVLLYFLLILSPQVFSIIFGFRIIKANYLKYRKALNEYRRSVKQTRKKKIYLSGVIDTLHTFAKQKSNGINPNRAGPLPTLA